MSYQENAADFATSSDVAAEEVSQVVGKKAPLTKEERIAKIDAEIAKLVAKREDVVNGVIRIKAEAAPVVLPNVGDAVTFKYGRKTPTTEPTNRAGIVVAVKEAHNDGQKRTPALIRVSCGEGFDAEFVTIFVGQIVVPVETAAE